MNWTQKYWDTIDQLWWSPSMLGLSSISKQKWQVSEDSIIIPKNEVPSNASIYIRTLDVHSTVERMRRLEEPLNHLFDITFAIAPCAVIQQLFALPFDIDDNGPFIRLGREVRTRYPDNIKGITQQDGYYASDSSLIGVEIKTGAQTSVEQVLKYITLMLAEEAIGGKRQNIGLLYVTPDDCSTQTFKQGDIQTDGTLSGDYVQKHLPFVQNKKLKKCMEATLQSYEDAASRLKVAHISWEDLLAQVDAIILATQQPHSRDETLERLLTGFATAIRDHRGTLPKPHPA